MYNPYIVKRTQIYLDAEQEGRLDRRARAEGTTRSALIRSAIDRFLRGDEDTTLPLTRFRRAVQESSGTAPYLPSGSHYVDEVRETDLRRQEDLEARHRG
jgi:predicted DNA-binding protein